MSINPGARVISGKSKCRVLAGTSIWWRGFTAVTRPSSITTTGDSTISSGVKRALAVITVFMQFLQKASYQYASFLQGSSSSLVSLLFHDYVFASHLFPYG